MAFRGFGGGVPFVSGYPFGSSSFKRQYKCYSMIVATDSPSNERNYGGKILLPASALQLLMNMPNIEYPMMFKLSNEHDPANVISTHAGVLEFTADEGMVIVPQWIMNQLNVGLSETLTVEYTSLPKASYCKFQAQSVDFVEDISDHRAILERKLRDFSCITKNDIITVHYLNKDYKIKIIETKPKEAVSVIDTDMNVDFDTPVGYEESENMGNIGQQIGSGHSRSKHNSVSKTNSIPISKNSPKKSQNVLKNTAVGSPLGTPEIRAKIEDHLIEQAKQENFIKFTGKANRLDGKKKGTSSKKNMIQADFSKYTRGVPNYEWKIGTLSFIRAVASKEEDQGESEFVPFSGSGTKLAKKSKKR